MRPALDFSFAPPDPADLARIGHDALSYVGNVRPSQAYLDDLRARSVAFTFIMETTPERAQEGYQAGVYDAQFADRRADERRYPPDASIYYAVSDRSRSDPSTGAERIAAYAQGIGDATSRPYFGVYGNRYACDAARAGSAKCRWTWVPVTWGADPSLDALIQEANTPPPIPGTDLNSVHTEFYGQWGATPPPSPSEDSMGYHHVTEASAHFALDSEWENAGTAFLAIALGSAPTGVWVRPTRGVDLEIVRARQEAIFAAANGTGDDATPVDVDAVVAAALAPIQNGHAAEAQAVEAAIRGALG